MNKLWNVVGAAIVFASLNSPILSWRTLVTFIGIFIIGIEKED